LVGAAAWPADSAAHIRHPVDEREQLVTSVRLPPVSEKASGRPP
jgi:hypothetical protein